MLRTLTCFALAALVAGPVLAQRAGGSSDAGFSDAERLHGFSEFWKEVDYNFAFFDQVPGLDWDSAYVAFVPRILAARDTFAYYRTLQEFSALLRDGHTGVFFPREFDLSRHVAFPPVRLEAVGRRAVVADVEAAREGEIPIGSEVLAVDGTPVARKLEMDVFPYLSTSAEHVRWARGILGWRFQALGLLAGAPGTTARLAIRTPEEEEREVSVERPVRDREVTWARPREPEPARFEMRWLDDGVAYIALHTFEEDELVADFRAALPELENATALLVDVRRNGGGNTSVAAGVARHLLADTARGSAWRTREHVAAYRAWGKFEEAGPEYRPYHEGDAWRSNEPDRLAPAPDSEGRLLVPTLVLTSWRTASAAEDFLVFLDEQPHVTFVGGPTFGSTGQPLLMELPGGGMARIVTKRDTYPDGRDFVGYGIRPDVVVEATVEDVQRGRDAVLERALDLLRGR